MADRDLTQVMRISRRTVLGSMATVGIASIAGCLGDDDVGPRSSFEDWYPASLFETDAPTTMAMYIDSTAVFDEWSADQAEGLPIGRYADEYEGIEREDLEAFLTMYVSGGLVPEEHGVITGDFDADAVAEAASESPTESDGYWAFEEEGFLLDDEALLFGADPWLLVDTYRGDEPRAMDAVAHFDTAIDDIDSHHFAGITKSDGDAWELSSYGVTYADEDTFEVVLNAYFASSDEAEAERDSIESQVSMDYQDVTSVTRDGAVVRSEAIASVDEVF